MADIKLHIACGKRVLPGWVNLDRDRPPAGSKPFDATVPWPYGDGTVDVVYSEDLFEHFTQVQQINFLYETRRVLKPDGITRIVTPDFQHSLVYRILKDGKPNFAVEYYNVAHGHVLLPTRGYMLEMLTAFGFVRVNALFRGSSHIPDFPGDSRPNPASGDGRPDEGQLYIEATKP